MDKDCQPSFFYFERQYFASWVYFLLGAIIVCVMAPFTGIELPQEHRVLVIAALLLGGGIVLLLSLNVFRMDSEINDGVLYIHFGILFPMIWKRISLADIVDVRSIVYRPLRDAGGWGWRCGRFDKHRTWFYNAKGNQGVLLTMRQGGCYIIGSQCPDVFKDALDKGGIPDGICSER